MRGWFVDQEGIIQETAAFAAPHSSDGFDLVNYDITDTEQFAQVEEYHTMRLGETFFMNRNLAVMQAMTVLNQRMGESVARAQELLSRAEQLRLEWPDES